MWRLQQATCLVLFVVACFGSAAADEQPESPSSADVADKVLAAVEAGDQDALEALAARDEPDPWVVVEALCLRGEHDVALAFAQAAPRAATTKLAAYVARASESPLAPGAVERLDAVTRLQEEKKAQEVLALLPEPVDPGTRVTTIRLALIRATAMVSVEQRGEGMRAASASAVAAEGLGWHAHAAKAAYFAGITAYEISRWPAAIESFKRSLKAYAAIGNEERQADALNALGIMNKLLGRYDEALRYYNRARGIAQRLGDHQALANVYNNIGVVHAERGNFHRALGYYGRSLKIEQQLGNKAGISASLGNIGNVHSDLGDFAAALAHLEHSLSIDRELGDRRALAVSLNNLGTVHRSLGNRARALELYLEARAIREKLGDRQGVASALLNIGNVHRARDEIPEALAHLRQALAIAVEIGHKSVQIKVLSGIGNILADQGDFDAAASHQADALELAEALRDQMAVTSVTVSLAHLDRRRGRLEAAADGYGRAESLASELGARELHVRALRGQALLDLARGRYAEAARAARAAVDEGLRLVSGLDEQQGAEAREKRAAPVAIGAQAAFEAQDVEALLYFAEQGRAGSLRESLRARATLGSLVIPQALRDAEVGARREEAAAQRAYRRAFRSGKLDAAREARSTLHDARAGLEQVIRKIQRAVKTRGDLAYPEVPSASAVRALLRPGEALVLYVRGRSHLVALTLTASGASMHRLPSPQEVRSLCAALDLTSSETKPEAALEQLRQALIQPLELGDDVRRVLVSPQGAMAYVPFAALLGDRDVAYVPSALTLAMLQSDRSSRGEKTLAVGDPDYTTGGRLAPLPQTRKEVEAIGDTVLLGRQATETRFRAVLDSAPGWRAVHLACHGLLDADHPLQSSLALASDGENDGRVTAIDVFRMKFPADLAVLSACETGKGRLYEAEGIVGLTRAFMFAGSPRVICSLWRVDDEATRELMIKFYELWNPKGGKGVGAAEALRKAQVHVRSHDKWKHPYYWAAWVLWGLPD